MTAASSFSSVPYPGLRPFRSEESDVFFGREEQTDKLLSLLGRSHFLSVVGPSGCGKSSLVRAGMIAALETGFMASAGSRWRIAEMRPGDRPMSRLAHALVGPDVFGGERGDSPAAAALLEAQLRRGPLGLREVLEETPLPEQTNLLVLVDQFEEIFRFREKGDPDEADSFVALLLTTASQRDLPIYVVITMRSDFLGDCALFSGLPEAINESQYLTPRLGREQCRSAISGPARVFGGDVEPVLVNRLLNDFGPDPDQLPLLQHALMRMWTRATERAGADRTLRLSDYEALGGLSRCLSDHADELFAQVSSRQRWITEVLFRRLSERGVGKRDTRAPARLSDVAAVAGVSATDVVEVVEIFRRADRSFLTPPEGVPLEPETLLDIGHESLIRQWQRLTAWVDEEARSVQTYQRLVQTAALWKSGDAALWGNPDLERALQWEVRQSPTVAWALRYGSAEDFGLAMRFLRESERDFRETQQREREDAEERQQREIESRTQAEREKRLQVEARAARRFKRLAGALGLALVAVVIALFTAWRATVSARQDADRAQKAQKMATRIIEATAAEEVSRTEATQRLERELKETARATRPAPERQQVKSLPPAGFGRENPPPPPPPRPVEPAPADVKRDLKEAFLTADRAKLEAYLRSPQRTNRIRFIAQYHPLGYKNNAGQDVFEYRLLPDPASLAQFGEPVSLITYRMDHPTFRNRLISGTREWGFSGSYIGWGCLSRVLVLIEYSDPARTPSIAEFDMCANLVEAPDMRRAQRK